MKTIAQLKELYTPSTEDGKKFVAKHVVKKYEDRNGNGDDVFGATKVKPIMRGETRHGYEPGEDEKVYEAASEGTTRETEDGDVTSVIHKSGKDSLHHTGYGEMDGIIHGRVGGHRIKFDIDGYENEKELSGLLKKAHPNLPPETHKKVVDAVCNIILDDMGGGFAEEVEQIDELSKGTLQSYEAKSKAQVAAIGSKRGRKSAADKNTLRKRDNGRIFGSVPKLEKIRKAESDIRRAERDKKEAQNRSNFHTAVGIAMHSGGYNKISEEPHRDVYIRSRPEHGTIMAIHNKSRPNHMFNTANVKFMNSSGSSWSAHNPKSIGYHDEPVPSIEDHLQDLRVHMGRVHRNTHDDHQRDIDNFHGY